MNAYLALMANNNERFILGLPPVAIDEDGDMNLTAERAPMSPEAKACLLIVAYLLAVTVVIPAIDSWRAKSKNHFSETADIPGG